MRRVVVTGMGMVSCLGNDMPTVVENLREGRSGITHQEAYRALGLRSQVAGIIDLDPADRIDRRLLRFMGDAAAYTYLAMEGALADAGLDRGALAHPRIGLVVGSGGSSMGNTVEAVDTLRTRGLRRVRPYMVPRIMGNSVSACLGTAFGIKGLNYTLTAACATSSVCIGHAMEQIQQGKQDLIFAGGGEEESWAQTMMFDAMGALSKHFNDAPERASRPFDADRDGFVISCGGGILVLEEREHARRRGATIHAELTGYGATSDGYDMVTPSGEGAVRCMRQALQGARRPIDYINAHGTATPAGDMVEVDAIREVFGPDVPPVSSTKSQAGHALGATGAHEAIYSLLMMKHGFIAPTLNVDHPDPRARGFPIVRERMQPVRLDAVMSNSFGFGGTNVVLVFERDEESPG